ncbi:MAG: DUF7455 domain-containing protein [Actinomycetes bacterium]
MTSTLAPVTALTASDRCDSCNAQAYVRVRLAAGGELLFCAHHARQHEEALRSIGAEIHDESERLLVAPAVPAEER